jgi:hypothetical protein
VLRSSYDRAIKGQADNCKGVEHLRFLETRLAELVDRFTARTSPDQDPPLAKRKTAGKRLPLAGSVFHPSWIARANGDQAGWSRERQMLLSDWNAGR